MRSETMIVKNSHTKKLKTIQKNREKGNKIQTAHYINLLHQNITVNHNKKNWTNID